jgi:hypothetical protein
MGLPLLLALAASAPAAELSKNPLLTQGSGGVPLHWTKNAYRPEETVTTFGWSLDKLGIGTLKIESREANDARWVQKVPVSRNTWYRITGWARADNVGASAMGAYLSVMGTFYNSRDLRGTQGWQPLGLWIKTGGLDTTLEIACRLGGYASLNSGTAYFTGISVEAAGLPAANQPFVYGADPKEGASSTIPVGMQVIAVVVALGLVLLVWRYVLPRSSHIPR